MNYKSISPIPALIDCVRLLSGPRVVASFMGRFFPYLGGKTALVPRLLELIPEHLVYVEAFGGSAELLFSKPRGDLQ